MHSDIHSIRASLKAKRRGLLPEYITAQSRIFLKVMQDFFLAITAPQQIGIYLAHKGELDLTPVIHWLWQQEHHLYAPTLADQALEFVRYTPDTRVQRNQYGLGEPAEGEKIYLERLDFVLVPLVAFDQQGHRMGMGKGFYDRSFAFRKDRQKPILIGCAYAFQKMIALPVQAHDIPMDFILTPESLPHQLAFP